MIHNGTLENHQELRKQLLEKNIGNNQHLYLKILNSNSIIILVLSSDTDSELII